MRFFSYFHDPDNLFVPLLATAVIPKELNGAVVAVTPQTTPRVHKMVDDLGFKIIKGGDYGFGRVAALRESINLNDSTHFFACDFDKMLHWLQTNPQEFLKILLSSPQYDVSVIARSESALKTYPRSWLETEYIASKLMQKLLGTSVDLMNGPYILSRKAAHVISQNAIEKQIGSCAEWCVLAYQAGLSIGNVPVDGLTWEDPDRYKDLIKKSKDYESWVEETYDSLYEWRKRVEFLHMQLVTMIRLTEEPVNPKYPVVSNPTFEDKRKN